MDVVLKRFFHHKGKMRAFGTITIEIFSLVAMLLKSLSKHLLCLIDLLSDFWQIGQLKRRSVFINQRFQVKTIETEVAILYIKAFLGKVKGLFYKIGI